MARVSADLLRLAADMLDACAEELGNNGCNDWSPPEWMSVEAVTRLQRLAWEGNGQQPDESPDDPVRADFVAVLAVARYLGHDLADLADAEARAERAEALLDAVTCDCGVRAIVVEGHRYDDTATRRGKDGDHG